MASLRETLGGLGVNAPEMSFLVDMLGFWRGTLPTDPDASASSTVSLAKALADVAAPHFHLNVIRVGYDAMAAADLDDAEEKVDYAIYKARNIYRLAGIGIGRVVHYQVTAADAGGLDSIGNDDEAVDLWRSFGAPTDGLDVFVVREITASDFVGKSPVGGDCANSTKNDGLLGGGNNRAYDPFARTFSHEIGHYLGLPHNHGDGACPGDAAGRSNLMAQTRCTDAPGPGVRLATVLTPDQIGIIAGHCAINSGA